MKVKSKIPTEILSTFSPLQVEPKGSSDEAINEAFRDFHKAFQKERVVGQLKERQAYEKPSEKKRRKRREAKERRLMIEARDRMMLSGEWEKRLKQKELKKQKKIEERQKKLEDYGI